MLNIIPTMERLDTDTTILPLDVTTELERLARCVDTLTTEEAPDENDRRHEIVRLHQRQAQIYLALNIPEIKDDAIDRLWHAWDLLPGSFDTLLLLEGVLLSQNEDAERVRLLLEGARHTQEGDIDLAAQWLARAVDTILRADTLGDLIEPLRRALDEPGIVSILVQHTPRVARELIDRLLRGKRPRLAHTVLERLVVDRHDPETFDDALRLASLCEDLEAPEAALDAYRRALSLRPAAPEALEPTRRHLLASGQHEQLAELLAISAPAAQSPQERARLWRELALLAEEKLADPDRAVQAWWRAWELGQQGEEPTQLKKLYAKEKRWTRYLDVLRQELLRTTALPRKIKLLRELATFQSEVLGEKGNAATTLDLLLQLAPNDETALANIVDLREELANGTLGTSETLGVALRTLRRALAATSETDTQHALRRRLLRLLLDHNLTKGLVREMRRLDPNVDDDMKLL
ncbi:MAG: hypothetical protein KAI47_22620, partial [Deltaproteobacteria bacterium]|nr:hypothetical protein [Deltaproteobacteria bacterium]